MFKTKIARILLIQKQKLQKGSIISFVVIAVISEQVSIAAMGLFKFNKYRH